VKAEIVIPPGWRRLEKGELLKRGDRWLDMTEEIWRASTFTKSENRHVIFNEIYIRKKTVKPALARGGRRSA
jgi:hypothetical protein